MHDNNPNELFVKFTTEKEEGSDKERTRVEIYDDPDYMMYRAMPSISFYTDSTDIKIRVRNRKAYSKQVLAGDMEFVRRALELTEKLLDLNK